MNLKKAVIFDLDGVLVESEKIYKEMNQQFFRKLGVEIGDEEYHGFTGIAASEMWKYIKSKGRLQQSVDELKSQEKELKFKTLSDANLIPINGVVPLLDLLRQ